MNVEPDDEELSEYVYSSHYIPLPRDIGNLKNIAYSNDKIYFVASEEKVITRAGQYQSAINIATVYSVNMDGTGLTEFPGIFPVEIPDDADRECRISLSVDDGGSIWIYASWAYYTPGYYEYLDGGITLRKIDPAGTPLLSLDLSSVFGQLILGYYDFPEITIQSAESGDLIYIITGDWRSGNPTVRVFNIEGKMLMVDSFSRGAQTIKMPDGTVTVVDGDGVMYTADISSGQFAINTDYPLTDMLAASDLSIDSNLRFINGGREFDILVSDIYSLYGINTDKTEIKKLLNWRESSVGINNVREIQTLPDGRIVCLYIRPIGIYLEKAVLILLEKTLRAELPEITELILAGVGITNSEVIDAVYDFNAANEEYQIKVVDYLQSDMDTDIQRLNLDIIAGKVPDILFTGNLPFYTYAMSGLFADLYPFIDADPDYGRDSFVQSAFRAAEYDGKLYRVFSGFWLNSIIGNPAVVGSGTGWDLDEFEAVLNANPGADIPIGDNYTSADFLRNGGVAVIIDEYINWETGEADFESAKFVKFLELVKRLGENVAGRYPNPIESISTVTLYTEPIVIDSIRDNIRDGRQLMLLTQIRSFVYNYDSLYRYLFGPEIVIKGFPSGDENGNVYSGFIDSLAIIDNSPNKAASWSFVRIVLDEEWQLDSHARRAGIVYSPTGFASNRTAFEKHARAVMSRHAEGVAIGHLSQEQAITQADIDRITDMIDSAINSPDTDETLIDIIVEEAEDYFSGIQSAENAAKIIQSRVSIYLSEKS